MAYDRFDKLSLDTATPHRPRATNAHNASFNTPSPEPSIPEESTISDDNASESASEDPPLMMAASVGRDSELSRLSRQFHKRGTSIKFDDHALLSDGNAHPLNEPLPGKESPTSPRNHDESARHASGHEYTIPVRTRPRRHSETEKEGFDPITGAPLHRKSRQGPAYHEGELRYPLVQATVDELAHERGYGEPIPMPIPPSLTSERTVSPIMEAVQTPNMGDTLLSPADITASPIDFGSRPFPSRRSVSQRSFGSLGSVGRRHTLKGSASSLSSPARSFLSQWTRNDEAVREPEPDDEGQEIGDDSGYIIGRKIGYGGFSVIKEVRSFENDVAVTRAVKIVRKQIKNKSDNENDQLQFEFEREVGVWRYLKHPFILPLIAVYDTNFATFCITKLNNGGTLFDLLRVRRKSGDPAGAGLPPTLAKKYIYELGSAIRYLHEDVRVVHRDIKPENVLLDMSAPDSAIKGGTVLLCDFGMADFIHNEHRHADPEPHMGPALTSTNVQGSLEYISPEVLRAGRPVYSTAADVWAYGCVAYALLVGKLAFHHEFQPRLTAMIQKGDYDHQALLECPAVTAGAPEAVEFVEACLALDADERPAISQLLEFPFLDGCRDLYEQENEYT